MRPTITNSLCRKKRPVKRDMVLYVVLFSALGMRPEVAFALALSALLAIFIWAVVGFVVFLTARGTSS